MASECDETGSALDLYELYSALNNFIEEPLQRESHSVSARSYFCDETKKDKWKLDASASKNSISDLYPIPEQAGTQPIANIDAFAKKPQAILYFDPNFKRNLNEMEMRSEKASPPNTPPEFDLGDINHDFLNLKLKSDDRPNLSEKASAKNFEVIDDKLLQKRDRICSTSFSSVDKTDGIAGRQSGQKKLLKRKSNPHQSDHKTPKKIKTEQSITPEPQTIHNAKIQHMKTISKSLKKETTKELTAPKVSKSFPTRKRNLVIKEPQWTQSFHSEADSSMPPSREETEQTPKPLINKIQRSIFEAVSAIFDKQTLSAELNQSLSSDAQLYLKDALKKKFYFDNELQTFSLRKVRRRTEEHFKFVTKLGFKFMFKNFKRLHNNFIRGNKLLDQLEFYRFYFGKFASDKNERLEEFFLPSSKIQREMHKLARKADKTVSGYLTDGLAFDSEPCGRKAPLRDAGGCEPCPRNHLGVLVSNHQCYLRR